MGKPEKHSKVKETEESDKDENDDWQDVPDLMPGYVLKGGGFAKRPKDHRPNGE